jgi:hypothetical protein
VGIACFVKERQGFMKKLLAVTDIPSILQYYLTVIIGGKEVASHATFFVFKRFIVFT